MPWTADDEEINGVIDANLKSSPPNPPAVNTAETVKNLFKAYWSVVRGQVQSAIEYVDLTNSSVYILEKLAEMTSLKDQTVTASNEAKLFGDGIEIPGGYNATGNVPALTANSATYADKSFLRVSVAGNSPFAFTNSPAGTAVSVGDKIRKDGTGWFLDRFVQKVNTSAKWVSGTPIDFNFTARTITFSNIGFWIIDNVWYNNNLVLKGPTAGANKVVNMPAGGTPSAGLNFLFININTQTYYCVNYSAINTVPTLGSYLVATWYDTDGRELNYFSTNLYYSKSQIDNKDNWLEWKHTNEVIFDFTAQTITIPQGYWLKDKVYYNHNLIANTGYSGPSVFLSMPTAGGGGFGINYLFADLVSPSYICVNQADIATVNPRCVLIATWYNPTGDQLAFKNLKATNAVRGIVKLATEAERTAGVSGSSVITPAQARSNSNENLFASSALRWVGTIPIDFNFTTQKITLPAGGYWVQNNRLYGGSNLALSGSTPAAVEINMPGIGSASAGINYFMADIPTGTYYCVNYLNRNSVPRTAVLIATWFDANGLELSYISTSQYAKKSTSLAGYGIADAYTKTFIDNKDNWLEWKHTSEVIFDFSMATTTVPGTITIPAGYWLKDKVYYNHNLAANTVASGAPVVVNTSLANVGGSGINFLFADLVGKNYYAVTIGEIGTVPAGSALIATWFNRTGDQLAFKGLYATQAFKGTVRLATEAQRSAGIDNSAAVTPLLLRTEADQTINAASNLYWIGSTPLVFDFTAQTITIPTQGFWSQNNRYYGSNLILSGASAAPVVINMPGAGSLSAGINYFMADLQTATYYCVNYVNRATVPRRAVLIATWYNANGLELSYFSPTRSYTKAEVDAKIAAASPFVEANMRLISAPKLFLINGVPLPIYKSSIVPLSSGLDSFKFAIIEKDNANNNAPRYRYGYEDILIDSANLKPSVSIGMAQTNTLKTYTQALAISSVTQASINGKTAKVQIIGTSLTNRGMPAQVKTQLAKYGVNVTMVGTMANTGGERGEGREGWEWENYIGKDNNQSNNGTVIVPSYANPSDIFKNPFIKLATASDTTNNPDWCFRNTGSSEELTYTSDPDKTGNFYIFDYANYLSQTGVATPDIIILDAWTNDELQDGVAAGLIQSLLSVEIMIRQIKAALPTVKIGIAASPVRGITAAGNSGWANNCLWIENCMQKIKTLSATFSNLSIVPIWMHTNRDFNFPVTSVSLSATNDTQVNTISDPVHWSTEGTIENACVMASYIANVI